MLNELYKILDPGINLFGYLSFRAIMAFIIALLISFLIGPKIIRTLKKHRIGEMIRQNGPESHHKKEGTPTMGGVIILLSVILPTILFADIYNYYIQILLISTSVMGIVGLFDDYLKVVKKYSKGLIARYKLLAQILLGIFVALMIIYSTDSSGNYFKDRDDKLDYELSYNPSNYIESQFSYSSSEISIPFMPDKRFSEVRKIENRLKDRKEGKQIGDEEIIHGDSRNYNKIPSGTVEVGFLLILLSILVISGSSNAINLTDGLDGLAAGLSAIVFFTLGIIAYASGHINFSSFLNITYIPQSGEIAVFCMAMVGGCLGFLWYNSHPANIFMGDTGSLALGAAMGTIAIILKKEILLIIIGGAFVIEALSVIMQVSFFKYTRMKYGKAKKLFLMAPIHHHYELKGLKESKIVTRFWIVGILLALLALVTLKVQ